MFVKLLGLLDLACAVILFMYYIGIVSYTPMIVAMLYLIFKCVIFFGDALSILDGIVAFLIFIDIFLMSGLLTYILAIYLLTKGLISMLS